MPVDEAILNQLNIYPDETFKEMIDAGVFYGRSKNKTHPRMKPFIYGNRNGIEIIDLNKTLTGLDKAASFLAEQIGAARDLILLVATQPAAEDIKKLGEELNLPTVARRWIGGTITNFKTIYKRIERLQQLKEKMEKGEFDKYTKKERLNIEREIQRLTEFFGSLSNLDRIPDVLLVIDSKLHGTAVREAKRMNIPVIAFDSTDADPDTVDYLVVGNNAARKSINWFIGKISIAIKEGRTNAKNLQAQAAEEPGEAGDKK